MRILLFQGRGHRHLHFICAGGSKSAYSTAIERKDFFNIEEIEVNGIDGVNADGQTEASGCYTFDGKRISTPQKGVNVIRYSDGTTKKVYVK